MEQINWAAKKSIARQMTDEQLKGALSDCFHTAKVMGIAKMQGKDASYYIDEASVYRAELEKRSESRERQGDVSMLAALEVVANDAVLRDLIEKADPKAMEQILAAIDQGGSVR